MLYIYYTTYFVIIILVSTLIKYRKSYFPKQRKVDVFFTTAFFQETQTRCYSDGENPETLILVVFDSNGNELIRKSAQADCSIMDFNISLTNNQTYNIVFWTQYIEQSKSLVNDMKSIKMLINDTVGEVASERQANDYVTYKNATITQSSIHTVDVANFLVQIIVGIKEKNINKYFKACNVSSFLPPLIKKKRYTDNLTLIYNAVSENTYSS